MLAVRLCGPRVVMRLESIGVHRLADLDGCDPCELMHAVNFVTGRTIWRPPMAILALQNLIDAAGCETRPRARQPQGGTLAPTG